MIVNLNNENKNIVVEYKCKKVYGTVKIKYIDEETGELIKVEDIQRVPMGDFEVVPNEIDGYELVEGFEIIEDKLEKVESDKSTTDVDELKSLIDAVKGADF